MFEHLQRQLRTLSETTEISVPLEADSEGFLDKECPSETCLFQFKILEEDWQNIVRDEEVFAPHAAILLMLDLGLQPSR